MPKKNLLDTNAGGVIEHDHNNDGINRRGFLKCMAWAGTGALCVIEGGVLQSHALASHLGSGMKSHKMSGGLSFVQISDSHMGFNKPANPDVIATLQAAVDKINALPEAPEFILHTGDISHLSKPSEFDNVDQILKATNKEVFFVPGEHDVLNDDGAMFRERYGKNSKGQGWYSFDKIPLWSVYPTWGWGTEDAARALDYLKRFGSVTVLNGHIHQTMQKVEGNVTFHTAFSTAFPQPAPGQGEGPGPMKVPAEQLRSILGITDVNYVQGRHALAVVDSSLA
jgi:3',5'-cyclic AMP phosphodiesterase CpdA